MRDDWPRDAGDDFVEPPCEIFFQLFIGNAGFVLNDDEVEADVPADDNDNSNDSILSYPSIHTMSDTSLPGFEGLQGSSDEGGNEAQNVEQNNDAEGVGNSVSDISLISLESWSDNSEPETEDPDPYEPEVICLDNTQSDQETVANDSDHSPEAPEPEVGYACDEGLEDEPIHNSPEYIPDNTSDSEQSSLRGLNNSPAYIPNDISESEHSSFRDIVQDDSNDTSFNEAASSSANYESKAKRSDSRSPSPLLLSFSDESYEGSYGGSYGRPRKMSPNTIADLYPSYHSPHDSNESCLSRVPTPDGYFAALGLRPLSHLASSPVSVESDDKNIQSVNASDQNSSKNSDCFDDLASASSAFANSVQENANTAEVNSLSELKLVPEETFNYSNNFDSNDSKSPDSVSENLNSTDSDSKLESANCFIENIQSEFSTYDDNLSGGCDIDLENSSGIVLEKPVASLKRKICSSDDDCVKSKVPKCSEEGSNESMNQGSLENSSKTYNSPANSTSSANDQMETMPSSATQENMIVTVEKPLEKTSVIEKATFQ